MYTRLNHLNVTLSHNATLSAVTDVSKLHKMPIQTWISEGVTFKFAGDNVDKMKGVRDIRIDHQSELQHMYSLLAVRSRAPAAAASDESSTVDFGSLQPSAFLPSFDDIKAIKSNLVVLVSRIICRNIKALSFLSSAIPAHTAHTYSKEMAKKSEVIVLDVLMKNEIKHGDMVEIMQAMQEFLGDGFPPGNKVLSGGDQVTVERQVNAKRHLMDGDTPHDRLDEFEIQTEDWHTNVFSWCKLAIKLSI